MMNRNSDNILGTDIYAITAEEYSKGKDNIQVVKEMLESGIEIIQYREKNKPPREKIKQCQEIRKLTEEAGCKFIVNDDVDIAMLVDADGIHVGQDDLPVDEIRKLVGNDMIVGLSTHSPNQAKEAVRLRADYIGVGPVFATRTKVDVVDPVGLDYVEYVYTNLEIPFVVIGGIKEHNIEKVKEKGAYCFALVTDIVEADSIQRKINELRKLIG